MSGKPRGGQPRHSLDRALALVERDLRKFVRSPMLIVMSLFMPLLQLIVLGNAFGGDVRNVRVAVVDLDRGPEATKIRERLEAIRANVRTLIPVDYGDQQTALGDVRQGRVAGVIIVPEHFSRDRLSHLNPRLAFVSDNTDRFVSSAVAGALSQMVATINAPVVRSRNTPQLVLDQVELYPFISYMKYLLPGVITLSMFFTAMVGGGIIYLDDKSRGVHEGYLVTPITKAELIVGFVIAGVVKAIASGTVVLLLGSLIAGVPGVFEPYRLVSLIALTAVTSTALIAMMFLLMARVSDPLIPRAVFGVLNMLLFFPSGAIYPIAAFPRWMQAIAVVDPFAYAVHGYRTLLLTQAGIAAVYRDIGILAAFTLLAVGGAVLLFRRTL